MSASDILECLVKAEYRPKLKDWQRYASQKELIGLEIAGQIYSSKGKKGISVRLPQEKAMYQTHHSLVGRWQQQNSLEQAEEKFRRKQLTTSYQYHHSSLPKRSHPNIFHYQTLQQLALAQPLTPLAVSFIDNWLKRNQEHQKHQEFLLACLRSIKSKVQVSEAGSTEMKTMYNWRCDPELSTPLRMDKIGEDLFAFKPNIQGIKRQEEKQRKIRERVAEIEKTDFAKQLAIFKDFKIN